MIFKAKLRKIGNSIGVLLPKNEISGYNIGDFIDLEVITKQEIPIKNEAVITKTWENINDEVVITKNKFNTE